MAYSPPNIYSTGKENYTLEYNHNIFCKFNFILSPQNKPRNTISAKAPSKRSSHKLQL